MLRTLTIIVALCFTAHSAVANMQMWQKGGVLQNANDQQWFLSSPENQLSTVLFWMEQAFSNGTIKPNHRNAKELHYQVLQVHFCINQLIFVYYQINQKWFDTPAHENFMECRFDFHGF